MIKILCITVVTLLPLVAASGQAKPEIDLIDGTVNGQTIAELNAEKVTDLFGRPTATTAPWVKPGFKAAGHDIPLIEYESTLAYGELGLTFRFWNPRSDPQQRIASIIIYLSQQTHEDTRTMMKPFSGTLSRGVTGNWKAKRVMEEFAQFTPTDDYDPKRAQEVRMLQERSKAVGLKTSIISFMPTISIKAPQTFIYFKYEEQTKFIEQIEFGPQRKDTK